MGQEKEPVVRGSNTLGNASLVIGIVAATSVFALILCALTSVQWNIAQSPIGTGLLICTATVVFLALIGILLGAVALFQRRQQRAVAIVGLVLSLLAVCLVIVALRGLGG